jgi:hypothetical protein
MVSYNSPPQDIQGHINNLVEGIKSKQSDITKFRKLLQVCLSMAHMTTLPIISQHRVLQN